MKKVFMFAVIVVFFPVASFSKPVKNPYLEQIDNNLSSFFSFVENLKENDFKKYRIFLLPAERKVTTKVKKDNYLDYLVNKIISNEERK